MGGAVASGIAKPISEAVADGLSHAIDWGYESMAKNEGFGRTVVNALTAMRRSFGDTPQGADVAKMIDKGVRVRQQAAGQLLAPTKAFKTEVAKNPQASISYDKNATLGQLYNALPTGHPAKNALTPLMAQPYLHGRNIEDIENLMHDQSNLVGRTAAFGPDSIHLAGLLHPLLTSSDPAKIMAGNTYLDIASLVFKDNQDIVQYFGPDVGKRTEESGIKRDVLHHINTIRNNVDLPPIKMDVEPQYKYGGKVESKVHHYTMKVIAPGIAIAHIGDFAKLPATVPLGALWKTISRLPTPQLRMIKDMSGIFLHTQHSIIDNDFKFRTGRISKLTEMPDVAAAFHKVANQPGFNNLRMFQLSLFGTAGYHTVQQWAADAVHGVKGAAEELRDVGLDPASVIRRRGVLTADEIATSMYHFVDNRLFIDRPLDKSRWSRYPAMRIATMLHGYVTREGRMITHELYKYAKAGDYGRIAQILGTVGVLWPYTIAPFLLSAGTLFRTADPKKAYEQLEKSYDIMFHPTRNPKETLATYFTLVGHFGGMGNFISLIHAAANNRLAAALMGPVPGVATGLAEDVVHGIWGTQSGVHNWHPLMRDALRYSVPVFGGPAANWIFPAQKESGRDSGGLHLRRRR